MTDPKTGIHEPTEPMVKIPEWMVINPSPTLNKPPDWFRKFMTDYWNSVKGSK